MSTGRPLPPTEEGHPKHHHELPADEQMLGCNQPSPPPTRSTTILHSHRRQAPTRLRGPPPRCCRASPPSDRAWPLPPPRATTPSLGNARPGRAPTSGEEKGPHRPQHPGFAPRRGEGTVGGKCVPTARVSPSVARGSDAMEGESWTRLLSLFGR